MKVVFGFPTVCISAGLVCLAVFGRCETVFAADGSTPELRGLSGVVVDDDEAELTGQWLESTREPPFVGRGYRHDDRQGQGAKSARFTPNLPAAGQYEVRLLFPATSNRATNAKVAVSSCDGEQTFSVNQQQAPWVHGIAEPVGVFRFEVGRKGSVSISNAGADGYVIIDAVQFVPVEVARAERAASESRRKARKSEPVQLASAARPADVDGKSYDLVVVGGTPGGIACAVRAAREGVAVLLVHHNRHLGGMMANGLGQWDALYGGHRAPLFTELLRNIEDYYRTCYGENSRDYQVARFSQDHYPLGWVEPHVAEREFNRLVAGEERITLLLGYYPSAAHRGGALVRSMTLREMHGSSELRVTGNTFVDATYEGDLLALAKVPYRVGREARDEYNEPHAGKVFTDIAKGPAPRDAVEGRLNIRPYGSKQGDIDPTSPFTADGAVQAYNYRFCLTRDPANRILLAEPPPNYRRDEYASYDRKYLAASTGPNLKSHMNSPILPGENHAYPEADWPTRRKILTRAKPATHKELQTSAHGAQKLRCEILKRHLEFALGLMYFLQNDESVSAARRAEFRQWGLPKDEFQDNDHVPYEMYVREARRIVGRHVYTQHDNSLAPGLERTPIYADSVAITDWYMDSHACTTDSRPGFKYDGKLILTEESRPGQIPYRSLLPQDVDNLLVPVCLSATHVAWGAVRLEPVWMQTGEAAGFAAALAARHNTTPAQLDPDVLLRTLVERRMMVSFFNDVDASSDKAWVPAVQYFGTKGLFDSYNALADEPLTNSVSAVWADTFGDLLDGKLDPQQRAQSLHQADRSDRHPVTANEFAAMLGQKLAAVGGDPSSAGAVVVQLDISPDQAVSRGDACRIMYVLSPRHADAAPTGQRQPDSGKS
jgi:hypothetical protein